MVPSSIHHSVARAWPYACVLSHASLSHISVMHVTMSGLLMVWSFEKWSSITASSLKHGIPCSMVFQVPSWGCRFSGQRYLSFTLVKSQVQRLRGSNCNPTSCDGDLKCVVSVPSKIVPSLAVSETGINNIDLLDCQVRSFLRLWRLSKDKNSVVISDSNSYTGCEGPDSPSPSIGQKDLVFYVLLWTQVPPISLGCLQLLLQPEWVGCLLICSPSPLAVPAALGHGAVCNKC